MLASFHLTLVINPTCFITDRPMMSINKKIINILTKYFRSEETDEERKELYTWYDQIDHSEAISQTKINDIQHRTKERLLHSIQEQSSKKSSIKPLWTKISVAASLLLISYFSYNHFVTGDKYRPLTDAQLAAISPGANKATITLSSGEIINLDNLENNQSMTVDNTVIHKDLSGQITYHLKQQDNKSSRTNTMQTPKAGQYHIVLSDGTKVFLNAESKLTYPENFGSGDRIVELEGEGYFEVSKTALHSRFIVKTNRQSTEVLGTKFNINAYKNEDAVKTTLAEGSIRVSPHEQNKKSIILQPNQQTILNQHEFSKHQVDASNVIGWTRGLFCFDGTNSEEIIRQISRWYDIDIEYNKDKNPITYSGKIPKNLSLDKLIKLLNYADIKAYAVTNQKNERKLIIN